MTTTDAARQADKIKKIILGPLLLIWLNCNLRIDKLLHILQSVKQNCTYRGSWSTERKIMKQLIVVLYKLSNFTHEIEQNPIKPTMSLTYTDSLNSLRPRRNGRYNADDIFKCIFLKENVWIPTKISLKFVPKGPINNIPALAQTMAWRRPGDKP